MTETDNLVLEQLRHIRAAIDGLREDSRETRTRIGHVEEGIARLHVQLGQVHVQLAEHSGQFDRLGDRLGRIEKRLDLVES